MARITYSIKKNRINSGLLDKFTSDGDGFISLPEGAGFGACYLREIDGAQEDSSWGRFSMDLEIPEDGVVYLYACAVNEQKMMRSDEAVFIADFLCNPEEGNEIKRTFFERTGSKRFVNQKDVLLYGLKGRYLFIALEYVGDGACRIGNMRIDKQGDQFIGTFPEVFRGEEDAFFRRYLSVFSSIYNDFDAKIENLPKILLADTCPAELLPVYASWMGMELDGGFFDEETQRKLVKEAYALNRMKGTRRCMERICELLLDTKVMVLEQNMMRKYVISEDLEQFLDLYGNSPYNVTILVEEALEEQTKSRLMFLLDQYRPIRSSIRIVAIENRGTLDSHTYLDMRASMFASENTSLDAEGSMDNFIILE